MLIVRVEATFDKKDDGDVQVMFTGGSEGEVEGMDSLAIAKSLSQFLVAMGAEWLKQHGGTPRVQENYPEGISGAPN